MNEDEQGSSIAIGLTSDRASVEIGPVEGDRRVGPIVKLSAAGLDDLIVRLGDARRRMRDPMPEAPDLYRSKILGAAPCSCTSSTRPVTPA